MLDNAALKALMTARHSDPFAVLGLHRMPDGRFWLRALLPGADTVEVLLADSGTAVVELLRRDGTDVFEARIPRRRKTFAYRLRVRWQDGTCSDLHDAYAFGPQLPDEDLQLLRDGLHPEPYRILGALPLQVNGVAGVRFAVWAPNALRVSVIGSFNQWDGRRHPMRLRHSFGVWEIFIPQVAVGDLYKFEIVDAQGTLLPAKADPYARAAELRPGTASRVAELPEPRTLPSARIHAQAIDTPALNPIAGTAGKEVTHFIASVVVYQGIPVVMPAFARICIFVQCAAVELREAVRVDGEMCRYPIQQNAQTLRMAGINKATQAFGWAEACAGRIQAQCLIAPRAIERKFTDGHQFNMGEAEAGCVGRKPFRQGVPVRKIAISAGTPGCSMHFVYADGCITTVGMDAC